MHTLGRVLDHQVEKCERVVLKVGKGAPERELTTRLECQRLVTYEGVVRGSFAALC